VRRLAPTQGASYRTSRAPGNTKNSIDTKVDFLVRKGLVVICFRLSPICPKEKWGMSRYGTILFVSILTSLFGFYETRGNPDEADCIMGHSFGTDISEHSVNRRLVDIMKRYANGRPIIADRMLVRADPEGEKVYARIIDGQITKMDGQSGTGKALANAQAYMDKNGLTKPLMVAQKYHIDRVVRQARKLGIRSLVPAGLPGQFDRQSKQFWTRNKLLFIPLNLFAYIKLKIDGKL
jgi:hypothetical protein